MSTNQKVNRMEQQVADQAMADGLTKHAKTLPSFLLGSTSVQTTDVITALNTRITTASTVDSTRATWQAAILTDKNERAKTKSLVSGVRQALTVMFAGSVETLADFGLKPRKTPATRTPEEKVAAVAKAKATRAARHTMGTKQKAAITGTASKAAPATPPPATAPVVAPSGTTTAAPHPQS
jgi:hypothetical protein